MIQTKVEKKENQILVGNFNGDRRVSGGSIGFVQAHLNGAVLPALTIGGVGTDPEYRRMGLVHTIFTEVEKAAYQYGCPLSFLHPFSFSYYRKKGYERVGDHRVLEFPMSALDFVPRFSDLTLCDDTAKAKDALRVYEQFAADRNIMFVRSAPGFYLNPKDRKTYLLYADSGSPIGYVTCGIENYYSVNRMVSVNLHVYELCYTDKAGLLKLLGFLRMYEGELSTVKIHNCAMAPEVERTLRHYMHTDITILPDLMARVHDVEAILRAVRYPDAPGQFTIKVTEPEHTGHGKELTEGIWKVCYDKGRGTVRRLEDTESQCEAAAYDIACDIPAFTQLIFGYESYGADCARYMDNVELKNDCADFFRAFPNRPCGLYEHF